MTKPGHNPFSLSLKPGHLEVQCITYFPVNPQAKHSALNVRGKHLIFGISKYPSKRDTSPLCHSSLPTRAEDAAWVQCYLSCLFQSFQWRSFPTLTPHISKSTASFQVILRWILYYSSWFHRMRKDILLSIILTRMAALHPVIPRRHLSVVWGFRHQWKQLWV